MAQTAKQQSQASPKGLTITVQKIRASCSVWKNFRPSDYGVCTTSSDSRNPSAHWKVLLTSILCFKMSCISPSVSARDGSGGVHRSWYQPSLLPDIDFMGSTDSSALSSELFPIPCSPQMAPAAPEVVSRSASTLHQPSTILFTKSIEQTDTRQKNHLVCSKRFLCSSSLWAGWNSSPCVACVCLHALDSKIFWQSRR